MSTIIGFLVNMTRRTSENGTIVSLELASDKADLSSNKFTKITFVMNDLQLRNTIRELEFAAEERQIKLPPRGKGLIASIISRALDPADPD